MSVTRHFALAAVAAAALTAHTAVVAQKGALQKIGKGEGRVDIVAWAGYIERGATDKNFDWVTDFEKKTGCKVNVKTAGTSDEMVALMNEGGFDLVTASGDASTRLIRGKKVQPINVGLVPSYKTVDPRLQKAPWHYEGTTHYGVPYQWGWNVLMYNTKVFGTQAPTSWKVVFEEMTLPDGKSNKGRVQAFDGPIHIADAAMYLMHHKKDLGIKDPYELTEAQYKEALNLLRGQRKIVGKYWHDAFVQIDDFTNEGVVASGSWQFQANILKSKKAPIATVVPVEGDLSAWFGSVPSVPAACKGNKLLTDEGCARQGYNDFEKISFWRTPVSQCKSQSAGCVPYHRWVTDYIAVLGGR
jgi:putative spermidine/putrescine transport system substrate-binding protein